MTLVGSSYKATIPKQVDGTTVEFYVSVTETDGTITESSDYSYTVTGGFNIPGLEIPGFPLESIIIGLVVGLSALYFLARKRTLSLPGTVMH